MYLPQFAYKVRGILTLLVCASTLLRASEYGLLFAIYVSFNSDVLPLQLNEVRHFLNPLFAITNKK